MLPVCGATGGIPELANAPIDPCFYWNKYPDLKQAFGSDYKRLIAHWFSNGIGEGRVGSLAAEQRAAQAAKTINLAKGKPATQSSEGWGGAPGRAVDGNRDGNYNANSTTHTSGAANDATPWWQVDLGAIHKVSQIKIFNRTDCCSERINGASVMWLADNQNFQKFQINSVKPTYDLNVGGAQVRYVRVQLPKAGVISLSEVEVFG